MSDLRKVVVRRLGLVPWVALAAVVVGVFATWLTDEAVTLSEEG